MAYIQPDIATYYYVIEAEAKNVLDLLKLITWMNSTANLKLVDIAAIRRMSVSLSDVVIEVRSEVVVTEKLPILEHRLPENWYGIISLEEEHGYVYTLYRYEESKEPGYGAMVYSEAMDQIEKYRDRVREATLYRKIVVTNPYRRLTAPLKEFELITVMQRLESGYLMDILITRNFKNVFTIVHDLVTGRRVKPPVSIRVVT